MNNEKIEGLMLRVLQWIERLHQSKDKDKKQNISQLSTIVTSLNDQANLNYHIDKLQEQYERLKSKESYYRIMLAERYEIQDERIFPIVERPNKDVRISLYLQKITETIINKLR